MISTQTFDLILTDVHMPDGNGVALLAELKNTAQADVPVVVVTGYSQLGSSDFIGLGAKAVLTKPFKSVELLQVISAALGKAQVG